MKKISFLVILIPLLYSSQINVKNQEKEKTVIIKKADSTQNFTNYKSAGKFLGLIGQKLFALPINPNYSKNFSGLNDLKYVTKEKVKGRLQNYKSGELVPVENFEFYNNNIGGKYFTVKDLKFSKGYFDNEQITPEEWQKENTENSTSVKGVEIYLTDESNSINLVSKLDGLYSGNEFISVAYFEHLKKKFLNKSFIDNSNYGYKIDEIKNLYSEPKEINENDIYTAQSIDLVQSDSDYSQFPSLKITLIGKSGDKKIVDLNEDNSYQKFSDKYILKTDYERFLIGYKKYKENKEIQYSEERKKDEEKINAEIELEKEKLYKKYGKKLGDKIFYRELEIGMTWEMMFDAMNSQKLINHTESKTTKGIIDIYQYKNSFDEYTTITLINNKIFEISKSH